VLADQHDIVSGVGQWLRTHMLAAANLSGKEKTRHVTRAQAERIYDAGMRLVTALVRGLVGADKNQDTIHRDLATVYSRSKALRPIVVRAAFSAQK
jgi:formamidopyrimidine-DNA glycosylase